MKVPKRSTYVEVFCLPVLELTSLSGSPMAAS